MYVPGKMKDGDKVLVDIGTGYYVEKVTQRVEYMCDLFLKLILLISVPTSQDRGQCQAGQGRHRKTKKWLLRWLLHERNLGWAQTIGWQHFTRCCGCQLCPVLARIHMSSSKSYDQRSHTYLISFNRHILYIASSLPSTRRLSWGLTEWKGMKEARKRCCLLYAKIPVYSILQSTIPVQQLEIP